MIQLYTHDFSEHWFDQARGELNEDGRFDGYDLAPYWLRPRHVPLLIRSDGRLVGFSLVNDRSRTGRPMDWHMGEFFIVRKHRRGGTGLAAAQAVFDRHPGQWETAIARRNMGALAFWRAAAARHPRVSDLEEIDLATAAWNGPVLRFRVDAVG